MERAEDFWPIQSLILDFNCLYFLVGASVEALLKDLVLRDFIAFDSTSHHAESLVPLRSCLVGVIRVAGIIVLRLAQFQASLLNSCRVQRV